MLRIYIAFTNPGFQSLEKRTQFLDFIPRDSEIFSRRIEGSPGNQ